MDVSDFLQPLLLDDTRLAHLSRDLSQVYHHLALNSTEQFLPTPINVLPKGTETGRFLAIDIGGSNLRVCFLELFGNEAPQGERIRTTHEKSWPIEDHFKMDNAEELFSWIGSCIALVVIEFIEGHVNGNNFSDSSDRAIPMGITFSFPMMYVYIFHNAWLQSSFESKRH